MEYLQLKLIEKTICENDILTPYTLWTNIGSLPFGFQIPAIGFQIFVNGTLIPDSNR